MKCDTFENEAYYHRLLKELSENPDLQCLKKIPQHKGGNTFSHSLNVARQARRLAAKWHMHVDTKSLLRGAMLHDFYLYDTETMPWSDYRHSIVHPKLALQNAKKIYDLNPKEQNIILSHMWPIPGAPLPRSKEAWLVCIADKICAWKEMHGIQFHH